ncbi:MAG: hypothetical protein MR913_08895 [Clostridiales bacterium]|nr:hypothetical protein [Clostridiales bacterium]
MKKKDDFDMDLDMDVTEPAPEEKPFSFNDLDLGLDMDLSWLDDMGDTPPAEEPKPEPPKMPPVKRPAPAQPAAPAKKPAAPQQSAPKRPAAPAQRPANGQRPVNAQQNANGQRPANAPQTPNGQRPANAQRPAGAQQSGNPQRPAGAKAPAKRPAAPMEQPPAKKKKSGPRLGGVIFYTLYFMFILVFFLATFLGLTWLHGWLTDYEMAQPDGKAEQVFTQLFTDPDWGALYDAAGAKDSAYEGRDAYVTYMEDKVGDSQLNYLETSAGLSGNKKYLVRLEDEKVASFTLVDKAKNENEDMTNKFKNMSRIPDWQLGAVEVFFNREGTYYIEKLDGHTAYVNDVPLTDEMTIQVATTLAEKYLPEGTTGVSMCTQQIDGLMAQPTVTIFDKSGKQMEVTYDEATRTFTERLESNTMSDDQREAAIKAAETYCNWMLAVDNDRGHAAQILDPTGTAYKDLTSIPRDQLWVQSNNGFTYDNINVSDFALYAGDIFSVRVTLDVNVTRTDGSIKNYPFNSSMFFRKSDTGKWMCFNTTNVDVSQPVGRVRLTFMSGETEVHSQFYSTDSKEIVTPVVPTPEGKVFTGWVTIEKDDSGATVYNLQFQPDAEGKVAIPEGTTLKPMTLYALFQNPDEAAATASTEPTAAAAAVATETEGA